MQFTTPLVVAATLSVLGSANPAPAPVVTGLKYSLAVRAPASPTDAWVSVDEAGKPSTVTPSASTGPEGSTNVIDGAPYDVTGTVFTNVNYAVESTSTGHAPVTATNTNGAGAFAVCHNKDGDFAPFCEPSDNSTLYPKKTYYVTWDTSYFSTPNTTVKVIGHFLNATTGEQLQEAFASGNIAAGWGFYQWTIDDSVPSAEGGSGSSVNVTIQMAELMPNATKAEWLQGPRVLVAKIPGYTPVKSEPPHGKALYIGLPIIVVFVVLMLFGTWLLNRKHRTIGLGNIMSRRQLNDGYGLAGSSGRKRGFGRRDKMHAIRLADREDDGWGYRDAPDHGGEFSANCELHNGKKSENYRDKEDSRDMPSLDVPRRDSDALGSLVGTPVEDRRMDFPHRNTAAGDAGGKRGFRGEVERHDRHGV